MDETIANWIIEFLLRQKIDDKIINGVISSLPLLNNDYRLKKTMLLRRIQTETNNGCVSEKILELIELIEALDHEIGKTASDLMKEAYCLVAVDCTVRFLGENEEENVKYMEMVEIVWENRVCKSEGLVSELSKRWLDDIEAAANDSSVCEKIWMRNTRNEALKTVKAYLKESWECLGPSFLELAAQKAGNEIEGLRGGNVGGGSGDGVVCLGTQKGVALTRRKHVAVKSRRHRGAKISDTDEAAINQAADSITETVRAEVPIPEVNGAKEAISSSPTKLPAVGDQPSDAIETPQTLSCPSPTGNSNVVETDQVGPKILESCEAVRIQRELRNCTKELHAAVSDPLPEALKKAQTLTTSMETNKLETVAQIQPGLDAPTIPEGEKAQELAQKTATITEKDAGSSKQAGTEMDESKRSNENDSENVKQDALNEDARGRVTKDISIQRNTRKRSLMEPNDTSHTFEWDDDIENSSGSPARPRLPSPKVQKTSPLKVPDYRNFRRRERKRWTPLEENTLREGVLKYGRGSWKFILNDAKFADVFQCRTEVDLKDKWRNLTKYS